MSYGAEGVTAIKEALHDLEQQMAFLGARMLQPERPGVEAAETARIHRMGEISILARLSNVISNSLTTAVAFMLDWAGIRRTDDHEVRLNDDFLPTLASSQHLAEMMKSWQGGAISHDSLWRFMQEGELVDPRRTVEEELAIIEAETPEPEPEDKLTLESQAIGVEQQRLELERQQRPVKHRRGRRSGRQLDMQTSVVKLADPDDEYRAEVVQRLEALLHVARGGEILSLVYVCERPGGVVTFATTRMKDRYQLLGFLDHQKFLINKSLDEDAEDSDLLGLS